MHLDPSNRPLATNAEPAMPPTDLDLDALLRDLRSGLERIYGPRLRGLYLFGSHARAEADPESDVDVLVVLDRIDRYGEEIDRTGELVAAVSLERDVSVSRVFATENAWRRGEPPFLARVRSEAVAA